MPAPSWPRMEGNSPSGSAPESVYLSVWQIPVALTSISTSPAFGPSSCTVSIARGLPASNATAALTSIGSTLQNAGGFGNVRRDEIHQRRRQAIVGLEFQFPQPGAYGTHLARIRAGFNDRGDERGDLRRRPAALGRQFGVDEIQAVERMPGLLDAAVQVGAAHLA